MRVLLDECLPRPLARELAGHDVTTVAQAGWSELRNGELPRRAADQFDVLITVDKLLEQQPGRSPTLIVLTLRTRTNRMESLRPLVPEILRALASARPGERVRIGS